ncbi:MAG TPA: penicillin-binding transpeptidase domain-containing protein [Candidatus Acidoferrales bacterium]|nr:penicillin-binding transpeptidase domain-containing protein [Candidatus Acidoferrales bacterium]
MVKSVRVLMVALVAVVLASASFAATVSRHYGRSKQKVTENASAQRRKRQLAHHRRVTSSTAATRRHGRYYERFTASSFSNAQTAGDITAGEDPIVRQAAIEALGNMNGTVVAIDPSNGRILAMVNQKLALSGGAQPCSTIKVAVALTALSEGVVTKDTPVNLGGHWSMNMTQALAHSNNAYFEALGRRLGFETVHHYAHEFGLGELAGWEIPGEHLGVYPSEVLPEKLGGVGKMCSFGESINMTPLQLGALMSAVANGGTLFYLQHPTDPEEVANFEPRVKRRLNIRPYIPEIMEGMAGAVQYGTARSLKASFTEEQIVGKTGTCSKAGTRYGWFASYANTQQGRIVAVFFLEGGRPTFGPKAAELTGKFYRGLYDHDYFAGRGPAAPASVRSVIQSRYPVQ